MLRCHSNLVLITCDAAYSSSRARQSIELMKDARAGSTGVVKGAAAKAKNTSSCASSFATFGSFLLERHTVIGRQAVEMTIGDGPSECSVAVGSTKQCHIAPVHRHARGSGVEV